MENKEFEIDALAERLDKSDSPYGFMLKKTLKDLREYDESHTNDDFADGIETRFRTYVLAKGMLYGLAMAQYIVPEMCVRLVRELIEITYPDAETEADNGKDGD